MRINILDAGLAGKGGHHFEHDRKLAGAFLAAGYDVHVYGSERMTDDAVAELAALCPTTRQLTAWQYTAGEMDDADLLELFNDQSRRLGEDLRAVAPADLWVWPTALPQQVHACVRLGVDVPMVGCLHEDRGIAVRATAAMLWPVALATARERGMRVTLGSLEPELCERFAPLFPCALLPQPYDGPPIVAAKTALRRVGLFGHQRPEKGAEVIVALVERLVGEGFEVVVHDSGGALELAPHPHVEVLGYLGEMAGAMSACDLVVLPYDPARYTCTGSGILAECLSLGVPVAATADTIPGNLVERHGVGPVFTEPSVEAIMAAVTGAESDYARYADAAFRTAGTFAEHNGVARCAAALLAAAA